MILFLPVFLTLGALTILLVGLEKKRLSLVPLAERLEPLREGAARFRVHTMMRHTKSLFSNYRVLDQIEREISVLEEKHEVPSQQYTGRFPMFSKGRLSNFEAPLVTLEALRNSPAPRSAPPETISGQAQTDA